MTRSDLKNKLQDAIDEMHKTVNSDEASANEKSYAGNVLKGLVREYIEHFGEEEKHKSKLKSVKNF